MRKLIAAFLDATICLTVWFVMDRYVWGHGNDYGLIFCVAFAAAMMGRRRWVFE